MKISPFSPLELGGATAKNRIARSATNDHLGNTDGTVSDAQIEMYSELGRNNVGIVITGHMSVVPDLALRADIVQPSIADDSFIPGLSRIPAELHRYGALAVAQISHAGPKGMVKVDYNSLTVAEIDLIVQWFVDAAVRAAKAGFDAVELHAAHWYMFAVALNSDLNKRSDCYGGDNERRVAPLLRMIKEIKRATENRLAVFVKLNAHNTLAGIDDYDMLVSYASALHEAGADLLDISGMSFAKQARDAECYFIDAASAVRNALPDAKIALVGGIFSRATIEKALEVADVAAMGRSLLTQPDFVTRLQAGELEKSRCIRCNKCFEVFRTKFERCIFGPVNNKLKETFEDK